MLQKLVSWKAHWAGCLLEDSLDYSLPEMGKIACLSFDVLPANRLTVWIWAGEFANRPTESRQGDQDINPEFWNSEHQPADPRAWKQKIVAAGAPGTTSGIEEEVSLIRK